MEKPQLINFIANILEGSGFKVYKNFKTTQQIVDIYAILPTSMGDFALVLGCKNNAKDEVIGIDVLKEMEMAKKNLRASKVGVITSSKFSDQAKIYAKERHIKLVDRTDLIRLAKDYNETKDKSEEFQHEENNIYQNREYYNSSSEELDYSEDYYYEDYKEFNEEDDERYRAEYLTRSYYSEITNNQISSNSLNRFGLPTQKEHYKNKIPMQRKNRMTNVQYNVKKAPRKSIGETLKPLLTNPVIDILLIVAISYFASFLFGKVAHMPTGYLGLIELALALILSFGLNIYTNRENPNLMMKSVLIFFASLAILLVLVLLL